MYVPAGMDVTIIRYTLSPCRYSGLLVPGRRPFLAAVTRSVGDGPGLDLEALPPLIELLNKPPEEPFTIPPLERVMRSIGMAHIVPCMSYTELDRGDCCEGGEVTALRSVRPSWDCDGDTWGITITVSSTGLDDSCPPDRSAVLRLLQVERNS